MSHARASIWTARLVAVVVVVLGLGGCAGLSEPSATLSGVSLQSLSLSDATLLFNVSIRNPYPVERPLLDLKYDLVSGDNALLNGTASNLGTIPARGSRTVSLPVKLTFAQVIRAVSGVTPGSVVPYAATLGLSATAPSVGRFAFPTIRHGGEVPVPAAPEVTLAGAPTWDKLSLSQIEGTIPLRVKNANSFRVELRQLDADLSIGGTSLGRVGAGVTGPIEAGASMDVPIKVALQPQSLGLSMLSALRDPGKIALRGTMDLDTPYAPLKASFGK